MNFKILFSFCWEKCLEIVCKGANSKWERKEEKIPALLNFFWLKQFFVWEMYENYLACPQNHKLQWKLWEQFYLDWIMSGNEKMKLISDYEK